MIGFIQYLANSAIAWNATWHAFPGETDPLMLSPHLCASILIGAATSMFTQVGYRYLDRTEEKK